LFLIFISSKDKKESKPTTDHPQPLLKNRRGAKTFFQHVD